MNFNTRFDTLLNGVVASVVGTQAAFVQRGYGQVEPNHLSAQRTGQIYAQLPAEPDITVLQQGQFVKYNYADGLVTFADYENADGEKNAIGEWMLVFNEIKLYRENQADCEFAMVKTDYKARIYSPYGEDKTGDGRLLQSRFYNGHDAAGNDKISLYKVTKDTEAVGTKTYYTKDGDTYSTATIGQNGFEDGTVYYELYETYPYDKVTTPANDIYELFQTEDPYHIFPGYKEAKMPTGTTMVPRVFKTNVGDIFTTNLVDEETLAVGDTLRPRAADGILEKITTAHTNANDFASGDTMTWQVVKVYTMPDGQQGVKIMRVA